MLRRVRYIVQPHTVAVLRVFKRDRKRIRVLAVRFNGDIFRVRDGNQRKAVQRDAIAVGVDKAKRNFFVFRKCNASEIDGDMFYISLHTAEPAALRVG